MIAVNSCTRVEDSVLRMRIIMPKLRRIAVLREATLIAGYFLRDRFIL